MSLSASSLTLKSGDKVLIKEVECDVEKGRRLAIIGRNGAGKSALLGGLAGHLNGQLVNGCVRLDGVPLHQWRASDLARRRVCLAQSTPVMLPFSVFEILCLGAEPFLGRVPGGVIDAELKDLTRRYEIDKLLTSCSDTLSGGELQRVHIVRVMLQAVLCYEGAAYLLLDEPAAALDLVHRQTLWAHIGELAQRGLGIAFVTHDLNVAARYADNICMLLNGQRYAYGQPGTTLTEANLQSVFNVGMEAMTDTPCIISQ